jgi:ASC-1-like (ASCH) protein
MSRVKEKVLSNVPYSPYNVMAEIEDIQNKFPDKSTLEDRVERAYKYFLFWTKVRCEKVREYRMKQGLI